MGDETRGGEGRVNDGNGSSELVWQHLYPFHSADNEHGLKQRLFLFRS